MLKIEREKRENENIEEKILMADEEIKQLQNKRKTHQSTQNRKKKRDKGYMKKGAVFESIFIESKKEPLQSNIGGNEK